MSAAAEVPSLRPYADAAPLYVEAGWDSPIPLGNRAQRRCKKPVPPGFTGRAGKVPTAAQIEAWRRTHAVNNIALHLPPGVIALDPDQYPVLNKKTGETTQKRGGEQLAALEIQLVPLPPTPRSTSRGWENPSGIRLYRVPEGMEFAEKAGPGLDIEVIQTKHRYVACWPSIHPLTGEPYLWYAPDGTVMDHPPYLEDLPWLPEEWIEWLRVDRVRENIEVAASLERTAARAWLAEHGKGRQCRAMRLVLRKELAELDAGGSRYDAAVRGSMALVKLVAEGHHGGQAAVRELKDAYLDAVAGEPNRDPTEWGRAVHGAIEKVSAGEVSPRHGDGEGGCPGGDGAKVYHRTDQGRAARMCDEFGSLFRYCYEKRSWLVWDGTAMAVDSGVAMARFAKDTVRLIQAEALEIEDSDARKAALSYAAACESVAKQRAMIESAQSEPGVAIAPQELNADPFLFNCTSGVLHLKTGRETPHDPAHLCTITAPVVWRGATFRDARWSEFLRSVTGGSAELAGFLQRAAFESLTGSTEGKFFINLFDENTGNTGKSAFMSCLLNTWGEYATMVNADVFLASTYGMSLSQESELAACDGKRLVISDEIPAGRRLSSAMMKRITMGGINATYNYRQKHEKGWRGKLSFTVWLDGNETAKAAVEDNPLWNRWRLVKFGHEIPKAEQVQGWADKVCADGDFRSAVLSWVLRGRESWLAGGVGTAPEVERAGEEVREGMDPLREFWPDCEFGPDLFTSNADLEHAKQAFAVSAGHVDLAPKTWETLLVARGCRKHQTSRRDKGKTKTTRGWKGISVQTWTANYGKP